jgi:GcrA cell cycle regulator
MPWPKEHDDALRVHVADGLTFSASADKLNEEFHTSYSRNAAIGRAKRLGLVSQSGKKGNEDAASNLHTKQAREKHRLHYAKRKRSPSADDKIRIAARSNLPAGYLRQARPSWRFGCDELIEAPTEAHGGVSLVEVEGCRWPSGDGVAVPFTFCNEPKRRGFSYCPGHVRESLRSADRRVA